jgi:hypothetical protein
MSYCDMANPYGPRPSQKTSQRTHCETCNRTMESKDWPKHEASKNHQLKKAANAAALTPGGDPANGSMPPDALADVTNTSPVRGGGGPGACHNCGQPGHISKGERAS